MTAVYPMREIGAIHSVPPKTHVGAVTGAAVDCRNFVGNAAEFMVYVGPGLAATATITFETTQEDPASPGSPDAAGWTALNEIVCCDNPTVAGSVVVDPAAEPYATDDFQYVYIALACRQRFVRAKGDVAGDYGVFVVGRTPYQVQS